MTEFKSAVPSSDVLDTDSNSRLLSSPDGVTQTLPLMTATGLDPVQNVACKKWKNKAAVTVGDYCVGNRCGIDFAP